MAGFTGGGGLGISPYVTDTTVPDRMMLVTVVLLVIIVQLIRKSLMRMSRKK